MYFLQRIFRKTSSSKKESLVKDKIPDQYFDEYVNIFLEETARTGFAPDLEKIASGLGLKLLGMHQQTLQQNRMLVARMKKSSCRVFIAEDASLPVQRVATAGILATFIVHPNAPEIWVETGEDGTCHCQATGVQGANPERIFSLICDLLGKQSIPYALEHTRGDRRQVQRRLRLTSDLLDRIDQKIKS